MIRKCNRSTKFQKCTMHYPQTLRPVPFLILKMAKRRSPEKHLYLARKKRKVLESVKAGALASRLKTGRPEKTNSKEQ